VQASESLGALARAVLDGQPVDWASAESTADPAAKPVVRQLRLLEGLAAVHRHDPRKTRTVSWAPKLFASPKLADISQRWGHLRILERIGRGAFGQVYRAWDERLDREVALKLIPAGRAAAERASSQIIHEGRLLARVRHANVVTVYGAEQIGDEIGVWMEFVRGRNLEQLLAQGKEFAAAEAADIGLEVCSAIAAVHRAGLLHRDIKAHNVMLADDGRVVLMDFGAGREFDDGSTRDVTGTPLYLAPEVLQGRPATVQSDLYSLGVLLYHLVTRAYPVQGRTMTELRSAHERRERTELRTARPDLPAKLVRVIARAIDPQPERRYASADALAADLVALKPRSTVVVWARRLSVAAAILLIGAIGWEVGARQTGSATRPSAVLSRFAGWVPGGAPSGAIKHPVIAVLPFTTLSREPGSDDLAEGLTVGLIEDLAGIDGLSVTSQGSSFTFKNKSPKPRDVGRDLGANLIVVGTLQLSGGMLRVSAQLLRAEDETSLWSDHFDRQITSSKEVLAIQDEMARAIVDKLRLRLGRGQRRYDETSLALPLLYQYYKARALQSRRGHENAVQAARLFEEIVAGDSSFPPAWAGLASALAEAARIANEGVGLPSPQDVARIRHAATKALELDPMMAEAHAAIGLVFAYDRDWAQAEAAFERALALNPSKTTIHTDFVASTLGPQGRLKEALQRLADAEAADPFSLDVQRVKAGVLVDSERYDEAIQSGKWVTARDPTFPYAEKIVGRALVLSGKHQEALTIFQNNPKEWAMLGYVYAAMGRREEAEAIAAAHPDVPGRLMLVYAGLGDKDRAFAAFERMMSVNWWLAVYQIRRPELALLRGDPRVAAVLRKLGLPPV
jgi:serine/threonine-protein kinase